MRYSVNQDDPGYANLQAVGGRARCWIDGVERKNVITADEELRIAEVWVLDKNGRPTLNDEKTDVLRETVHGSIRVEPNPPSDPVSA